MHSVLAAILSNIVVICVAVNANVNEAQASGAELHAVSKTTLVEEPWIPEEDEFISLATGRQQLIKDAPAGVVVITEEDIRSLGATNIGELLELVPGFHNLFQFQGDQYVIRGVRSAGNYSPDVLVMIDGIPKNDILLANQRRFISLVPLFSIKRIEIIRGPYSALYGADAYSGVVNIITKKPSEVNASQVGLRAGSYDTKEFRWIQQIPDRGVIDSATVSVEVRDTHGHAPVVRQDYQTLLDQIYNTQVSLAPGKANTVYSDYNIMLDIQAGDWILRGRVRGHETGFGIGLVGALDPEGRAVARQWDIDALYNASNHGAWGRSGKLTLYRYSASTKNATLFPKGSFGGAFPQGVMDNVGYTEEHAAGEITFLYRQLPDHHPRVGLGMERVSLSSLRQARNYIADPATGFPIASLPQVVALPDAQLIVPPSSRGVGYVFLQDEWTYTRDWTLTSGIRYDHYNDFGGTLNPRLGLVWNTTHKLTSKLLLGSAFRAPTLLELYGRGNAFAIGNPDLRPARLKGAELAFDYRLSNQKVINLSLFSHKIKDSVAYIPGSIGPVAQNAVKSKGYGGELSVKWPINESLEAYGYYAYQNNYDTTTHSDHSYAPHNKIKGRLNWKVAGGWDTNAVATWVANRVREAGDPRPPASDYTWLDVSVRYQKSKLWSVNVAAYNLFDAYAESANFIIDIPLPGRSIFISVARLY